MNSFNFLGIVRRFYNLGDRISARKYKTKDGKVNTVVRYLSVEIDANPKTLKLVEEIAKSNSESLLVYSHKLKDMDYFKNVVNTDKWKNYAKDDEVGKKNPKDILNKMEDYPDIARRSVDEAKTVSSNLKIDSYDEIKNLLKL